jgi:phenylacetate-CoA ligase
LQKNAFMSSDIREILPEIISYRPDVIFGNTSYFRLLAQHLPEEKISYHPKMLFSCGEPTDEPNRKYLESRLACDVYHGYGAWEFGPMVMECFHKTGMHVFADGLIMEILKDGQPVAPGEPGEIVATGLLNRAMPFIRYRLRDIGSMRPELCSCGRTLPLLGSVEGRAVDFITIAGGRTLSPKAFLGLIHSVDGLPPCQLVQEDEQNLELRVFKKPGEDITGPLATVLVQLESWLGPSAHLRV